MAILFRFKKDFHLESSAKKGEVRWWGLSKMIIGRNFNDSGSLLMLELLADNSALPVCCYALSFMKH